jgi:hypothetical protein
MTWLDLTSFRFGRAQDRGNDKNLCRHHPDINDDRLILARFQRLLSQVVERSQNRAVGGMCNEY